TTPATTSGPIGPIGQGTTTGPAQGNITVGLSGQERAPVQPANVSQTTAPPISFTVKYTQDPTAGDVANRSDRRKTHKLFDHTLGKVAVRHHPRVHESLIEHLARERVSRRASIPRREGR